MRFRCPYRALKTHPAPARGQSPDPLASPRVPVEGGGFSDRRIRYAPWRSSRREGQPDNPDEGGMIVDSNKTKSPMTTNEIRFDDGAAYERCSTVAAESRRGRNRRLAGPVDRRGFGSSRNARDHRATDVRRFRRLLDDHSRRAKRRPSARGHDVGRSHDSPNTDAPRLLADTAGRITCSARANAVKGRVPS